ncbi:DUF4157 domain-containing protein [Chloroflexia bacterium SDU3-3]|nr:DUF4157 domain-containing protein [Chloroflexia bacterium SDU3-3]
MPRRTRHDDAQLRATEPMRAEVAPYTEASTFADRPFAPPAQETAQPQALNESFSFGNIAPTAEQASRGARPPAPRTPGRGTPAAPAPNAPPLPAVPFSFGSVMPTVQPSLRVSRPGDRYEQEAEAVAAQVMRSVSPTASVGTPGQAADDERAGVATPPDLMRQIASLRGGGLPLPAGDLRFFEQRMGADFSQVRIHTGDAAALAARQLSARAFTVGGDIAFDHGEYRPGTSAGRELLAHELAHVVQQGRAAVRVGPRQPDADALAPLPTAKDEQAKPAAVVAPAPKPAPKPAAVVAPAPKPATAPAPRPTPAPVPALPAPLPAPLPAAEPQPEELEERAEEQQGLAMPSAAAPIAAPGDAAPPAAPPPADAPAANGIASLAAAPAADAAAAPIAASLTQGDAMVARAGKKRKDPIKRGNFEEAMNQNVEVLVNDRLSVILTKKDIVALMRKIGWKIYNNAKNKPISSNNTPFQTKLDDNDVLSSKVYKNTEDFAPSEDLEDDARKDKDETLLKGDKNLDKSVNEYIMKHMNKAIEIGDDFYGDKNLKKSDIDDNKKDIDKLLHDVNMCISKVMNSSIDKKSGKSLRDVNHFIGELDSMRGRDIAKIFNEEVNRIIDTAIKAIELYKALDSRKVYIDGKKSFMDGVVNIRESGFLSKDHSHKDDVDLSHITSMFYVNNGVVDFDYALFAQFTRRPGYIKQDYLYTDKGRGDYKNVLKTLRENIGKGSVSLTDSQIMICIEDLHSNGLIQQKGLNRETIRTMKELAILLFMIEPARNPGHWVSLYMASKMIKQNNMSIEDAFASSITPNDDNSGGLVSMSMEKAIIASKTIDIYLRDADQIDGSGLGLTEDQWGEYMPTENVPAENTAKDKKQKKSSNWRYAIKMINRDVDLFMNWIKPNMNDIEDNYKLVKKSSIENKDHLLSAVEAYLLENVSDMVRGELPSK